MATNKAIRADDVSGLNIATVSFSEDAVTKHAQQIVLADATTPTQKAAVDASGNVAVIAAAHSGTDIGDVTINNASGASAVNIQDGGNSITVDGTVSITANSAVNVAQVAGTTTDTNSGNKSAGTQRIVIATDQPQLTNALKVDGSGVTQPISGTVTASFGTATSGGYTIKHLVSAGSTNATSVKASAGQVYGWSIFNVAAYPVYVKFHNTSGTPTAGSGVVQTVAIQAGVSVNVFNVHGIAFGTGIGITIVKDLADAGTTAVLAADCVVDIFYA